MGLRHQETSRAALWWIALGAAMWGLDAVFIVALLHHFSSTQIVLLEHAVLMLFAVPVLVWKRRELTRLNTGDWLAVLFIAWGASALATILFTAGFVYGNPNVVLILQKLQPLFAVLLASWLLREKMQSRYWLVLIAALAGAYLLTFGWALPVGGGNRTRFIGSMFAVGAAALWGGATVMGKRLVGKVSFSTVTALRFSVALPLLLCIVVAGRPHWPSMMAALRLWPVWANLLFQAVVPSLMSLLLYYFGLRGVRASYATIAELAFPATGLLLNWLVLHQTITFSQWVGFAVVWFAVLGLSWIPNKERMNRPQRTQFVS